MQKQSQDTFMVGKSKFQQCEVVAKCFYTAMGKVNGVHACYDHGFPKPEKNVKTTKAGQYG